MTIGKEIEKIQKEKDIPILFICNAMGITEAQYYAIIAGKYRPSTYQLIMFVAATKTPLKNP